MELAAGAVQLLSPVKNVLARGPVLTRSFFSPFSPIKHVLERGVITCAYVLLTGKACIDFAGTCWNVPGNVLARGVEPTSSDTHPYYDVMILYYNIERGCN